MLFLMKSFSFVVLLIEKIFSASRKKHLPRSGFPKDGRCVFKMSTTASFVQIAQKVLKLPPPVVHNAQLCRPTKNILSGKSIACIRPSPTKGKRKTQISLYPSFAPPPEGGEEQKKWFCLLIRERLCTRHHRWSV